MAEMFLECPHCGREKVGFDFGGELPWDKAQDIWNCLFMCRNCWDGIVVKLQKRAGYKPSPSTCHGDPRHYGFDLLELHPKPPKTDAPEHVPNKIAQNYEEAMDNLQRQNWTSAGIMFRKVLERSTLELAPDGTDFGQMSLFKRIDALAERHAITPAMQEWAHIIRDRGNEAAHEEFDKASAKQIQGFTEIFLIYAFTLPTRVEQAQGKTAAVDESGNM